MSLVEYNTEADTTVDNSGIHRRHLLRGFPQNSCQAGKGKVLSYGCMRLAVLKRGPACAYL